MNLNDRQRAVAKAHIENAERLFWPLVLIVGSGIKSVAFEHKLRFWRDIGLFCFLITVPATLLEAFTDGNGRLSGVLVSLLSCGFLAYILRWREWLKSNT